MDKTNTVLERKILSGEVSTFGTVLAMILTGRWESAEWLNWENDTVLAEVEADWGVKIPDHVQNMLWALSACLTEEATLVDPLLFNQCANALSGEPLNLAVYEPAEPREIAWLLTELALADSDEQEVPDLHIDVQTYILELLKEESHPIVSPLEEVLSDVEIPEPTLQTDDPVAHQVFHTDRQEQITELKNYLMLRLQEMNTQITQLGFSPLPQDLVHETQPV